MKTDFTLSLKPLPFTFQTLNRLLKVLGESMVIFSKVVRPPLLDCSNDSLMALPITIFHRNWGSVWRCQQLQSSNSRSASSSSPSRSSEQTVAKLCHRQRSGPSQARVRSLWNEFKVLRGVASSVRTEKRKRNGRNGEGDESYDASSLSRKANGNGNGIGRGEEQDWHPNIVRFQEFIISPSYACLFMPYYPQPMNVALPEHIYRDYFQGLACELTTKRSSSTE